MLKQAGSSFNLKKLSRSEYFWPLVLTAAAFCLRLAYLLEIQQFPFVNELSLDPGFFDRWGLRIASGKLFTPRAFFAAPLYAYLLGLIYALAGHNLFLVRLLQITLGSINVLLLFYLAKHYFSKRVGYLAIFLYLSYGFFYFYDGLIIKCNPEIFLNLLFICFLARFEKIGRPGSLFAAGIFLGAAAATRGNIILVVPFLYCYLYYYAKKKNIGWLGGVGYLTVGVLLAISPFTIHNYLVSKDFVLINSNGGVNFYIGNNPQADGTFKSPPGIRANMEYEEVDYLKVTKELTGKELAPSSLSRYWGKMGLAFLIDNPLRALKLYGRKALLFWNQVELSDNDDYYFYRSLSVILKRLPPGFGLVAPLGLAGGVVFFTCWPQLLLLYIFCAVYFLSTLPFFIFDRYRLGMVPLVIIFAAAFVDYLWQRLAGGQYKKLLLPLGVWAAAATLVFWPLKGIKNNHTLALSFNKYGYSFYKVKKYEQAIAYFHQALACFPAYAEAYNRLGITYLALNDYQQAAKNFQAALAIEPNNLETLVNYAQVLERLDAPKAREVWQIYLSKAQEDAREAKFVSLARQRLRRLEER